MKSQNIWLSLVILVAGSCCGLSRSSDGAEEQTKPSAAAQQAEFSAYAKALPYPPDTREIEFRANFKRIEFTSQSTLGALVAFYRSEMKKRGWTEDAKAEGIEDDSVDLTFNHDDAQVKLELDKRSKATLVRMACKKLDFGGTNDPAALQAAGVPQPRSYLYLQKNISLPEKIQDLAYSEDSPQTPGKDGKSTNRVVLNYRDAAGPITVVLTPKGEETTIQITTRNEVKAKQDGVFPEAGKARLILGNAHTRPVVITIVKRDYTLKPGQGGRDLKSALNYTVVAGKYPLTIKIPGEKPQTEELNIAMGTTWGVIALPTGGYFVSQLY